LESLTYDNRSLGWYNLGVDGSEIQVEFVGIGGDTIRPGPKCIRRENYMHIINSFNPRSIFLQIGGNDLSRENIPKNWFVISLLAAKNTFIYNKLIFNFLAIFST
jgi:hypothetical protein